MNLDQTTELVPVSQWVYDLYEVKYWTREGGTLQRMQHYAASSEGHMWSNANEYLPGSCEFISWKIVRENVGHPHIIGNLHGLAVHENALSHGRRLTGVSI